MWQLGISKILLCVITSQFEHWSNKLDISSKWPSTLHSLQSSQACASDDVVQNGFCLIVLVMSTNDGPKPNCLGRFLEKSVAQPTSNLLDGSSVCVAFFNHIGRKSEVSHSKLFRGITHELGVGSALITS